jgi:hypothetical protein
MFLMIGIDVLLLNYRYPYPPPLQYPTHASTNND